MQIICQHFPTEPLAYQWQAWAPAYCMYDVYRGYGSTKHHAIMQLKRALGVPESEADEDDLYRLAFYGPLRGGPR